MEKCTNDCKILEFCIEKAPSDARMLIGELLQNREFLTLIESICGIKIGSNSGHGGYSMVYDCTRDNVATDSVVRFSSYRCLSTAENTLKDSSNERAEEVKPFKDINCDANFRADVMSYYFREGYAYTLFDVNNRANFEKPFIIKILCKGTDGSANEIYDYIFCLNMPKYKTIYDAVGEKCDEKTVLKICFDVLSQLTIVHDDGVRHRDIKYENIMFDESTGSYLLIDWGASCKSINGLERTYVEDKKRGMQCTSVYVDPWRLTKDEVKAYSSRIDLYSLGVFMLYMVHPEGYNKKSELGDFYKAVSLDANKPTGGKSSPLVLDVEKLFGEEGTVKKIDGVSEDYLNIVYNAMNHDNDDSFKNASSMGAAVKALIDRSKNLLPIEKTKKPIILIKKTISIPGYVMCVLPLVIAIVFTILHSGFSGDVWNSMIWGIENPVFSICSVLICFAIPALVNHITMQKLKIEDKKYEIPQEVLIEASLFVVLTYVLLELSVSGMLKGLDISYPLCFNCINILIVSAVYLASKKWFGGLGRILGCAISGMFAGFSAILCLEEFSKCWTVVAMMGITGALWGLLYNYCVFTFETRLIRKKR